MYLDVSVLAMLADAMGYGAEAGDGSGESVNSWTSSSSDSNYYDEQSSAGSGGGHGGNGGERAPPPSPWPIYLCRRSINIAA